MKIKTSVWLLIALTCLFSLAAPATAAEDTALYGRWEGTAGTTFVWTFAEKGVATCTISLGKDVPALVLVGTYKTEGNKLITKMPSEPDGPLDQENTDTYKIIGNKLLLTSENTKVILTRVKD